MPEQSRPKRRRRQRDPLVTDLSEFIRSYVVMTPEKLLTVALWTIHTHCFAVFGQTPYLVVTSPEKQCGKSRLLEVLELLVARPWPTILPSEAVVFRKVDLTSPTLLLDETDTIFNPRNAERFEGLRALLNSGHRPGIPVSRCVGTSTNFAEFRTFCPKVLAGIGTLPDTITDRALPIRLERRTRDEKVQRFFRRTAGPVADDLRRRVEEWCGKRAEALAKARPEMPDELSDRMQEGCEPLVAIADALGWGVEARGALVTLLTAERLDNTDSVRLRLLRDIRTVFEARQEMRAISTATLLAKLVAIEESGWDRYYGRQLEPRDLASLLRHYDVFPTTVRMKDKPPAKGYRKDALVSAWERYL